MAETSMCCVMARTLSDVITMKDTLVAQQQLLQKLYAELDQEREASATAASEALDMILRLQGEKAVVKMEANQYKRMTEEKIGHVEATLEVFEELMNQKEMEIASLEFQIKAYKHKLLNLGCDLNASEFEAPEYVLLNRSDQQNGENGQCSNVRRLHSLPPLFFKNSSIKNRVVRKIEGSPSPDPVSVSDVISKAVEESSDQEISPPSLDSTRNSAEVACATLDSYWNQIKTLDEKVKVISDCIETEKSACLSGRRARSSAMFSQASTKITCDQTERLPYTNSDKAKHGEGTDDRKAVANPPCSPNVHDVFEVPQTSKKHKVSEHVRKRLEKLYSEVENRLTKPDSVYEGMVESHVKHSAAQQKGLLGVHSDTKVPSLKDMMTANGQKREGLSVDCNAQAEFQKLHQRIERLERERISTRQEIIHERDAEEQLRLLKDIQNQLTLMQSEMRSLKIKKATPKDDVPLGPLQEAMLHFWL